MIALTQTRSFNTTSHAHLRVGHTHEDVDAVFSICTNALRTAQNVETPRDLQRLILQRVGPVFTKRGLDFDIEIVEVVACYQDSAAVCKLVHITPPCNSFQFFDISFLFMPEVREWTAILPASISLKNCYRARGEDQAPVPQSFTFMRRGVMPRRGQGLQVSDRVPRALRTTDMDIADSDVFVMVKETMAASSLSQDPLLVMPGMLLRDSERCLEKANHESCPVVTAKRDRERHDELQAIYMALKRDFPHMRRGLAFYESMLRGDPSGQRVPKLTFLQRAHQQNQQRLPPELGARPQAPKPHELQVRFHRNR